MGIQIVLQEEIARAGRVDVPMPQAMDENLSGGTARGAVWRRSMPMVVVHCAYGAWCITLQAVEQRRRQMAALRKQLVAFGCSGCQVLGFGVSHPNWRCFFSVSKFVNTSVF